MCICVVNCDSAVKIKHTFESQLHWKKLKVYDIYTNMTQFKNKELIMYIYFMITFNQNCV